MKCRDKRTTQRYLFVAAWKGVKTRYCKATHDIDSELFYE